MYTKSFGGFSSAVVHRIPSVDGAHSSFARATIHLDANTYTYTAIHIDADI